ncbi:hypothetical protein BHE74_00005343 [Ensete ventricosum]|nr:hypothetical protein GW17_00027395 [Ensete ventricosum]RWW85945.1 hypothetical protein BHE74_00005343 [Ensete ventricosum]RZS06517.1 hypothetical protein BHM03_00037181 [Ensete ventricosum]
MHQAPTNLTGLVFCGEYHRGVVSRSRFNQNAPSTVSSSFDSIGVEETRNAETRRKPLIIGIDQMVCCR